MVASQATQRMPPISIASFTAATTAIAGAPSAQRIEIELSYLSPLPVPSGSAHLWPTALALELDRTLLVCRRAIALA